MSYSNECPIRAWEQAHTNPSNWAVIESGILCGFEVLGTFEHAADAEAFRDLRRSEMDEPAARRVTVRTETAVADPPVLTWREWLAALPQMDDPAAAATLRAALRQLGLTQFQSGIDNRFTVFDPHGALNHNAAPDTGVAPGPEDLPVVWSCNANNWGCSYLPRAAAPPELVAALAGHGPDTDWRFDWSLLVAALRGN